MYVASVRSAKVYTCVTILPGMLELDDTVAGAEEFEAEAEEEETGVTPEVSATSALSVFSVSPTFWQARTRIKA